MVSGEESEFLVEEHFHPKSAEHFKIKGKMYFTLDGQEYIAEDGEFFIPRGVVHSVRSPKGEYGEFKVRGDHDIVEERDFLMQMFTLVETVSRHKLCWSLDGLIALTATFRTSLGC